MLRTRLYDAPRNTYLYSFSKRLFAVRARLSFARSRGCGSARPRARVSDETLARNIWRFASSGSENGSVARKKQRLFRSRRFRHTRARDARSLDADTPALAPELALDDPRARST